MKSLSTILITVISVLLPTAAYARPFVIEKGKNLTVSCPSSSRAVLNTALEILNKDLGNVFGNGIEFKDRDAALTIRIDPVDVREEQGFVMASNGSGKLIITAHDSHGAAYGVMEISRLLGVSPWEWWADAAPQKRDRFELPENYVNRQHPSVKYRGIFINDEDWGLMPWSSKTFEPSDIPGHIGPKTNAKIFELLLRLRANTYWPAMHECTLPFFLTEGNREVAEKYGIYIGGSHCEPMACNAAGEWARRGKGDYDYVNNSDNVYRFWEDRVKDVANQEILYTIGMRGVHDGAMNGAKTIDEQKNVLTHVFQDQRKLLADYVNKDVTKVAQVFIPYKEVLDVYNAGLEVPEDVTLMWCDDNYGYIRHFPTEKERARKGGNGIYYHVSYWGRPHDYLWLGTVSPYLLYQQMTEAYDKGIRDIWILNVGDIKPAEYQIELFMDMAWNMDKVKSLGPSRHLSGFLAREFGASTAEKLLDVMNDHYRLAFIRKPEFMGNTRVEEKDRNYYSTIRDLPWSIDSIDTRLRQYKDISDAVEEIWNDIPANRKDTYFQLIKYPVQGAAQMNVKALTAQKARRGLCGWEESDEAFDSIVSLTAQYNRGFANNGKWNGIMDYRPRRLPVFDRIEHKASSDKMTAFPRPLIKRNGKDAKGEYEIAEGLGYESGAISLIKNKPISFIIPSIETADSLTIDIRLLPTHPIDKKGLAFDVSIDGEIIAKEVHYETAGRSEKWKLNVLSNQSQRKLTIPNDGKPHRLTLTPLTEGILLDQLLIYR